jgi:hypothetical protein
MAYVYIKTESCLWTVGHYQPDGKFYPESDHDSSDKAAERVAYLNGQGTFQARFKRGVTEFQDPETA